MRFRTLTAGTLVAVAVFAVPFLAFAQSSASPSRGRHAAGESRTTRPDAGTSREAGSDPGPAQAGAATNAGPHDDPTASTGAPADETRSTAGHGDQAGSAADRGDDAGSTGAARGGAGSVGDQEDEQNAGGPSAVGAEARARAHAKVAEHLRELLESGVIENPQARANIEAVVQRLLSETLASGEAHSEAEALAEVEAALEAEGPNHSAEELDVLAEVQARQGKKAEALETLKVRLAANPHTRVAYEKYVALESELGTKQDLDTFVEGKKVEWDVRPFVEKGGRTLVPVRKLVEAVGADVTWDRETGQVTIVKGNTRIVLAPGSQVALVNGAPVQLEVPAQVVAGSRTVVPLRFIAETLGLEVTWLEDTRTIVVTQEPVQ